MKRLLSITAALFIAVTASAQSNVEDARLRMQAVLGNSAGMSIAAGGAAPQAAGGYRQLPSGLLIPKGVAVEEVQPPPDAPEEPGLADEHLAGIQSIAAFLSQHHVDSPDSKKLFYGALRGMIAELDPHSEFFTAEEFKKFSEHLEGNAAGLGVLMRPKKANQDGAVILGVYPGSPAREAGLKARDVIIKVNGKGLTGLDQEQLNLLMRGPEGSEATIEVRRRNRKTKENEVLSITSKRASYQQRNMLGKMLDGGKGYIYFQVWQPDTEVEFFATVDRLLGEGMKELIVDLRLNGGGAVTSVTKIAASFLTKGQTVFSSRERDGRGQEYRAGVDGKYKDLPLKILVNDNSASASEIFAGCVQDHKRGKIIGTKTYGKGSGQSVLPFSDGSSMKLTMMRWYTPSGRSIDGHESGTGGVVPDAVVPVDPAADIRAVMRIRMEVGGMPKGRTVEDPILAEALK